MGLSMTFCYMINIKSSLLLSSLLPPSQPLKITTVLSGQLCVCPPFPVSSGLDSFLLKGHFGACQYHASSIFLCLHVCFWLECELCL
jgi:hypothetical protein